ncbi:hypothetical protein K2173_014817 [Erythroxylum novogranatense]|uniref:BSD domain-containing protein n=1 Tax=Erythroxylum novogranatense TaxID=1862640 RepID=A0AAV8THG7_9ROSI|nr:hypothetical protein K2173_014817 [Erythroxylum novogranatense]
MSWLARSIANSLKLDDDDGDGDRHGGSQHNVNTLNEPDAVKSSSSPEADQHSESSSTTTTTTPRGVKEDISELTKTLTRQFWGVASFLAPPPPDASSTPPRSPRQISSQSESNDDEDPIAGIRSDFAEISGKFKSGITKLSSNKTVSEITKIASNFLQFGPGRDISGEDLIGNVVGVTEEVVAFAKDIAMHPETWLDFPLPDEDDFEDLDMTDAQQEHALAVEHVAPRLAALRIELCPGYMSEGCFWKIYFVLLHPRLSKEDALLLSTPQIMEARAMLSHELQKRAKAKSAPEYSVSNTSASKEASDLHYERSLSVTHRTESEPVTLETFGNEAVSSSVATEIETDKHPVQSMEIQIIDKAMVEEQPVNQATQQRTSSFSSSRIMDENLEDDADDWLKDESSESVGASNTMISLNNEEDVSFSDLEDDDGEVPVTYKNVASSSDTSTKDSRDWVQLSRSSGDSVKDISTVSVKHVGSDQVSAHNSDTKESNDWLDVDDIDAM